MRKSLGSEKPWARWALMSGMMLLSTTAMAQDFGTVDGVFGTVGGTDQSASLGLFGDLVATGLFVIENWAAPLIAFFLAASGGFNGFYKGDWGRAGMMLVGAIVFAVFPLFMSTLMSFGGP